MTARTQPRSTSVPAGAPGRRVRRRQRRDRIFLGICLVSAFTAVAVLMIMIVSIFAAGVHYLSPEFVDPDNGPSRFPERAGLGPAMVGSILICAVCAFFALPLGVGTAVLLEEYAPRRRWLRPIHEVIQLNITNLAGVPSVVYGILGLTVFVQFFDLAGTPADPALSLGSPESRFHFRFPFGRSVLAGGLTLMLVILPIIITASQEAVRAVPDSLREAALAMGATRWQMISRVTLPASISGIMTGSILAMSRAMGEAAPILIIAGVVYIRYLPVHLMDRFTAMPLQIYDWASRPQEAFHQVAASGIIVLLTILLVINGLAVFIRHRFKQPLS